MRQTRFLNDDTTEWLCREILEYLRQNPNAADTLEGIVSWWLLEQRIRHTVAQVKAALKHLEVRQQIKSCHGADGRIYYRQTQ